MPLFRKQSTKAKKRLQHQQYLAKESPSKTYDISDCELTEVPSGTYSLCKVLQKEALLLHDNRLTCLKGGGHLKDLQTLRVLDLHNNDLSSLPDDISCLKCLQVLNLEGNQIKHLPPDIGELKALQTLNLRGNVLKDLPESVASLQCLRVLDVSRTALRQLPATLSKIRTLEQLILDAEKISYPPSGVCSQGTEAMMKFLCSESGIEYEPPSKYLLDVLDGDMPASPTTPTGPVPVDIQNEDHVRQYQVAKVARQEEVMRLHQQMEDDNRLQAKLAAEAARNKQHLVDYVAQDQERIMGELSCLQQQKDEKRRKLVQNLQAAERNASTLVEKLLEMNEQAKHSEELAEKLEQERIEREEWFKVRQEEVSNLRKQEVLMAMQQCLAEQEVMNQIINTSTVNKDAFVREAQMANNLTDGMVESVLNEKHRTKKGLVMEIIEEERLQKQAFSMLQLQMDTRHSRIRSQIELIHLELAKLTTVELQHRDSRQEMHQEVLEQRRQSLTQLLMQLISEKDKREAQLVKRLIEMEDQREQDQTDYWLVQYQRLMDRKPQQLIDQENNLEYAVIEILRAASATEYIPIFARHRVSIETMCSLDDDDLKQMGVNEPGLRRRLLQEIAEYKARMDERAAAKLKEIESFPPEGKKPLPSPPTTTSLPPSAPDKSEIAPSSPPMDVMARGINSECVVCMDALSCVLFLPCGHVCCCVRCSEPIEECPMCRGDVIQRIYLTV